MRYWTTILILALVPGAPALRQFDDEYPNITVCESTLRSPGSLYDMPDSYTYLRGHFGGIHGCTHIEGNLVINNIWDEDSTLDLSFLKNVEEVSGMVRMFNNTISRVILPKLKVIRGEDSMSIKLENGEEWNVSVYMTSQYKEYSDHLLLPSLRVISKHSVYFNAGTEHPYLPHSIRWSEFFEDEESQRLITINRRKGSYPCHVSCGLKDEKTNQAYCWSSDSSHCQKRTNCRDPIKGLSKWCFRKKNQDNLSEGYCSDKCIGGCTGVASTDCEVCKHFNNGRDCVSNCPPEFINEAGAKVLNPKFKMRVGQLCASSCPENLIRQEDACLYRCTRPQYQKINGTCVQCNGNDGCGLNACQIRENCVNNDSTTFYMTKDILAKLTDCQIITGLLHFTERSFKADEGAITVPMMYQHMMNIRVIIGNLEIDGTNIPLHNLTFLQNLVEIRYLKPKECPGSINTALSIFESDIQFLGLRRLRRIYGDVYIPLQAGSKIVCYVDTLPWKQHILRNNRFRLESWNCGVKCSDKCDNDGCWGPTSSMCYNCKGVRTGYNCVDKCEDEPGYYYSYRNVSLIPNDYDNGLCQRCNTLCFKNCTGPSAYDCVGGCRVYEEEGQCLTNCSSQFYLANKTCLPCHKACLKVPSPGTTCTGGGDYLGPGGCNFCEEFILKDNMQVCYHHACPVGYFSYNTLKNKAKICKPCTAPCSECLSNLKRKPDCIRCKGFWNNDECVERCIDMDGVVQPQTAGGICNFCHKQCLGCYSAFNATQCVKCRRKRIVINPLQFTCVSSCSGNYSYAHLVNHNEVCSTAEEGLKIERSEHLRKVLTHVFWILGPAIFIFALGFIIIFKILKKSNKMKASNYLKAVYSNIHEPDSKILLFNKESKLAQPNMNRLLLIPTTNITFDINGKPLGTGAFGSVYRGIWRLTNETLLKKERNELDVAIKVIQVSNQKAMVELLAEAKIMASVSHKHCLRLIGVCLLQKQPCLVTTFMELGSLDKYLKKYQNTLSSYTLLSWAEQIADGMAYLEMRGIIHRDLATRNVLVNSSHLVQITDFGLSRILQGTEDNNEIVVTSGQVPIRWLAPETLSMGIYSHKTDVWAYGVTLWEIFTFGERPYDEMPLKDIPIFISQNNRLAQPEICSLETYVEMLNCWKEPQYRSSFQDLMTTFYNFSKHPTYYLNIPNDTCLINDQCSGYEQGTHYGDLPINYAESKQPLWRSFYRQQPSLDGTITTCLEDYPDSECHSTVKRQSSDISYLSSQPLFQDGHDGFSPFLSASFKLSEALEEDDGYLEPNKRSQDDHEYLEPLILDLNKTMKSSL